VASYFLCWNWNASLLNSTWGYNFNWRNTVKQTACSNLSCTLVMERGCQKSKRLSHTAKFKLEVIRCAEDKGNCKAAAVFGVDDSSVRLAETQGGDQWVWGVMREIYWTQERMISWNWWCSLHVLSRKMQDWTVCELWSTLRGGNKRSQIFEHSLKSF